MEVQCPLWIVQAIEGDLATLHSEQTAPFTDAFRDYLKCLQQMRELQVRALPVCSRHACMECHELLFQ